MIGELFNKLFGKNQIEEELKKEAEEIIKSKNELFQPCLKDEYIISGTWNTYSHHDYDKFKNRVDENKKSEYNILGLEGDEVDTLKHLCGSIESGISYWTNSANPQIDMNNEIIKNSENILKLISHIKEQI